MIRAFLFVLLVFALISSCSSDGNGVADDGVSNDSGKLDDVMARAEVLCKEKGDCEQAIKIYTEAIASDSNNAELYKKRAMVFYATKRFEQALNDLDSALEHDPPNPGELHYFRGLTKSFKRKEDKEGACRDLKEAKKLGYKPNDPGTINKWIVNYCRTNTLQF
ncbi:tetratricopeptide repeat protein [Leptolyngbya sp. 7M]|uniref:tetratricopeptide repeat protein n=1 Tax=Leptolyngbya sp. 7M TaxID=2812896 RepID=UPI001B8AAB9B|nr:tetratricopeptide repeat protein [Leptolyngbya sp. 7M]QYO66106.1 tetratricopeptide repeat protein [Leptolyngbya sp. 7M]